MLYYSPAGMKDGDDDWVETLTRWSASVGMNPIRVRWKLRRWQGSFQRMRRRGEQQAEHVQYQHRVCPQCTSVQDKDAKVCTRCGASLGLRSTEKMRRLGFEVPTVSLSLGLGVVITLCYARLIASTTLPTFEVLFTMDGDTLWLHGSWHMRAFLQGQWWRVLTSMFLHIGMWHAAFNLYALATVGPHIEEMYGRGRTLFFFLLTGVVANLVSGYFSPYGNAGASGALMGLIGMAAARGHLSGGAHGRQVRDLMLKWVAYTMIFGFVMGADNWAHGGGFVAGGLIGLLVPPRVFTRSPGREVGSILGFVGVIACVVAVYFVMVPPLSLDGVALLP